MGVRSRKGAVGEWMSVAEQEGKPLQGEQIEWTSREAAPALGESLRGMSCGVTKVIQNMKGRNVN